MRQLGDQLPFTFPDGTAPVVARVQVYCGASWRDAIVPMGESGVLTFQVTSFPITSLKYVNESHDSPTKDYCRWVKQRPCILAQVVKTF